MATQRAGVGVELQAEAVEAPPAKSLSNGHGQEEEPHQGEDREQEGQEQTQLVVSEEGDPAHGNPDDVPDEGPHPIGEELPAHGRSCPPLRPAGVAEERALNLVR